MKGYIFTISAACVYASQVILGKYILTAGTGAWTLAFMQVVISTLVMFVIGVSKAPEGIRTKYTVKRADFKWFFWIGVIGGLGVQLALYYCLERVDAGIGSMLLFLHPVVICIFFLVSGVRKVTLINKISLVAVLLGSLLVLNIFGESHTWTWLGIFFGVICFLCCAGFFLILDLKLSQYPISVIFFYDWGIAAVIMLIINPMVFKNIVVLSPQMIALIVIISSVTTVLPSFLLAKGVMLIGSERATVVGALELPITVLLAYLFLSEVMVPMQLLGVVLVVSAVAALSVEGSKTGPLDRVKRSVSE
jgi:drug/metabolite transporter (DMT)-like permease